MTAISSQAEVSKPYKAPNLKNPGHKLIIIRTQNEAARVLQAAVADF